MEIKSRFDSNSFDLKILNNELLLSFEKQWLNYFEENDNDSFANGYYEAIKLAKFYLAMEDNPQNEYYFVLTDKTTNSVLAVVSGFYQLANTKKSCLKIRAVRTSPEFDSRNEYENERELVRYIETIQILSGVVVNSLQLIYSDQFMAHQFKLWGNKQADNNFFTQIILTLNNGNSFDQKVTTKFFNIETYNRWLEITKT